jgi:hypothetical protein
MGAVVDLEHALDAKYAAYAVVQRLQLQPTEMMEEE